MNKLQLRKQSREYLESLDYKSFNCAADFQKAVEDYWISQMFKIEKAFGGCTECYGKGYNTQQTAYKSLMNFCTCPRGKSLKKLLKK